MSFRFRLGPFTFGRPGTRLSLWRHGSGFSVPLSGKSRSFGRIGFGPFSWYFSGSRRTKGSRTVTTFFLIAVLIGVFLLLLRLLDV